METLDQKTEKLTGSVERVTFHSEETGYAVLRLKAKGKKELVTLVGTIPAVAAGSFLEAEGRWIQHAQFGMQFKAETLQTSVPTTREGMEKYLGSGLVKGIGPHFAKKMIDAFGDDVLDIIEHEPKKLRRISGIGPTRLEKIIESWAQHKAVSGIMVFLQSHGVTPNRAARIYKTYGTNAVERVRENPYQMARDIPGVGFKSADSIALRLGVERDSLARARAGIQHVLAEKQNDGHCGYPEDGLIEETAALLEVSTDRAREALAGEVRERFVARDEIEGTPCIYPVKLIGCEVGIAERLRAMAAEPLPWKDLEADKAVEWVESALKLDLAPLQREAVKQALSSKCLVITGGPGTGKTTLVRSITTILARKKVRLGLCSPTGRAAKRLSEATGLEAKTIHRLLGYDKTNGGFLHDLENLLDLDLLIVDETSMVDVYLMHSLLKALPKAAALILVGDTDQIPSVGPGTVLHSLLKSGKIPSVRLTQIFRQALTSRIVSNAHRINQGLPPETPPKGEDSDFYFFPAEDPPRVAALVRDLVVSRIPRKFGFSPADIQVLSPMHKNALGTQALNLDLQKALNPNPTQKLERFGTTYAAGDKVMVTLNDYDKDVFNGDIGFITGIDSDEQRVKVDFDGREVEFDFSEMDMLQLAYAITIHKSQGSEYPVVILPIHGQHYVMLRRNLLYTAVTRGKKLVVLVGQASALAKAIESGESSRRWTRLAERIREAFSK